MSGSALINICPLGASIYWQTIFPRSWPVRIFWNRTHVIWLRINKLEKPSLANIKMVMISTLAKDVNRSVIHFSVNTKSFIKIFYREIKVYKRLKNSSCFAMGIKLAVNFYLRFWQNTNSPESWSRILKVRQWLIIVYTLYFARLVSAYCSSPVQ